MWSYLAVALGSALGGGARYGCGLWTTAWIGDEFPWGTIVVNVVGSFVIGFFSALTSTDGRLLVRSELRVFVTVGLCGGYTTFSAFSLQTLLMLRNGDWLGAIANVGLSMVACLLAVWLGHGFATAVNRPAGSRI